MRFVMRPWITALLLGLAAGPAAARAQEQQPPPSENPVKTPGNALWASTPDEAKAWAARDNKLVFIEFGRNGCGNCRRMEILLYPAFDFEALLISMVPVKVDLDSSHGRELAQRYGIKEPPAILITSTEGRMVFLLEGFLSAPDFYEHVYADIKTYKAFARKVEAQDIPRLAAREALDTGAELWRRSDPGAALPRLKRAVSVPKAPAAVRDPAREILAAAQLDLGQTAQSRETINRLIATTKDAARRERAEIFRAQIPLAENKPQEAFALFQKFQKDHPDSPYKQQVNAFLERLTGTDKNP
jgi:thiol-disulfide isomerase/thioredoxin